MTHRLFFVVAVALVAACGGVDDDAADSGGSTATSASTDAGDDGVESTDGDAAPAEEIELPVACSLLTAQEIAVVTGGEVLEGKDRGAPTGCQWRRPPSNGSIGDDVVLIVVEAAEYHEGQVVESALDMLEDKRQGFSDAQDAPGIGDAAFSAVVANAVSVYAAKGDILLFLVLGDALTDLGLTGDPVETATTLAEVAVSKLP